MSSSNSAHDRSARIVHVGFESGFLCVDLSDGRILKVPLSWFPTLAGADAVARANFHLIGSGIGIHWPDLDEDVSLRGLFDGKPSAPEFAGTAEVSDR